MAGAGSFHFYLFFICLCIKNRTKDLGPQTATLPGDLTLGLKPNGVVLTSEGKRIGETPLQKQQMAPGRHNLILRSKDGHYERQVSIEIEPGQSAIYRFMLTKEDEVPGWTPPDAGPRTD